MPRAAVESWRDDAAFRVRRFNGPSDLAAVLEVCLTTGEDASAQFPTQPEAAGHAVGRAVEGRGQRGRRFSYKFHGVGAVAVGTRGSRCLACQAWGGLEVLMVA